MDDTQDLSLKLNALLNDPGTMDKLRGALASLGADAAPADPPPPPSAAAAGTDLSSLTALLPLLNGLNQEDENTALLKALRPYLHGDREKKLNDSIKLLQLIRFLPLLKDKGIL